jgi:hypothetical protein
LHLDNSINWTPLYAAPVISAISQPRRQGNEKMHMSIFKLIVGVIFNVAFFGVLLFCQQVLWIGGEEKRVRPQWHYLKNSTRRFSCCLTSRARQIWRGFVSNRCGFGRRLTALGSTRPGRSGSFNRAMLASRCA